LSEILPELYVGLHVKYPSFLSDFMNIYPVGSELFHAGRQTHRWTDRQTGGHNKAGSLFCKIANLLKTGKDISYCLR